MLKKKMVQIKILMKVNLMKVNLMKANLMKANLKKMKVKKKVKMMTKKYSNLHGLKIQGPLYQKKIWLLLVHVNVLDVIKNFLQKDNIIGS
jgi:hypothetical protein